MDQTSAPQQVAAGGPAYKTTLERPQCLCRAVLEKLRGKMSLGRAGIAESSPIKRESPQWPGSVLV